MSKPQFMDWLRAAVLLIGLAVGVAVLYSRLVLVEYRLSALEESVKALVDSKVAVVEKE